MESKQIKKLVENHFKVPLKIKNAHKKYSIPKTIYHCLCDKYTKDTIKVISKMWVVITAK